MFDAGSLLIAAETNRRSPQTTGLDTATPSTGVFHNTFSLVVTFHVTAVGDPLATPDALGPRNIGQFCALSPHPAMRRATKTRNDETFIGLLRFRACFFEQRDDVIEFCARGGLKRGAERVGGVAAVVEQQLHDVGVRRLAL